MQKTHKSLLIFPNAAAFDSFAADPIVLGHSIGIHFGKNACPGYRWPPAATPAKKGPSFGRKAGARCSKGYIESIYISFEATDKRCSMGRANSASTTPFASSQRRLPAGVFYSRIFC